MRPAAWSQQPLPGARRLAWHKLSCPAFDCACKPGQHPVCAHCLFGQRHPAPPHSQPTSPHPALAEDLETLLGPRPYRSNELRNIDKFREGFNKDGPGGKVGTPAWGTQLKCLPPDKEGPQLRRAPGRPPRLVAGAQGGLARRHCAERTAAGRVF